MDWFSFNLVSTYLFNMIMIIYAIYLSVFWRWFKVYLKSIYMFIFDEEDNETLLLHRINPHDIYRKQKVANMMFLTGCLSNVKILVWWMTYAFIFRYNHTMERLKNMHSISGTTFVMCKEICISVLLTVSIFEIHLKLLILTPQVNQTLDSCSLINDCLLCSVRWRRHADLGFLESFSVRFIEPELVGLDASVVL